MDKHLQLKYFIDKYPQLVGKVVDFNENTDRLLHFDFTSGNTELRPDTVADTEEFSKWINKKLSSKYRYGIGGYFEHRTLYSRSKLFNADDEPRSLHLGVDIWAKAGAAVYAPLSGTVHSFQDNNNFGDYGPTIILEHELNGFTLYSLYGHLSRRDLQGLMIGQPVKKDQQIASFGNAEENGHWPPHLHFQLMFNMEGYSGDYPGVCKYSEMDHYRINVPDPNLILRMPVSSY